jgi:hypothetical protein
MDLAELERIEKQVNESGENFAKENGSDISPTISGRGDDDAFLGSVDDERIY